MMEKINSDHICRTVTLVLMIYFHVSTQMFLQVPLWHNIHRNKHIDTAHLTIQDRTYCIYLVITNFMMMMVYWCFFLCASKDPGRVSKNWIPNFARGRLETQLSDDISNTQEYHMDPSGKCVQIRYCGKCRNYKPIRTHHCSVCEKCTLRMDHHCSWLGNCIGYFNYPDFIRFLVWMFLCSLVHEFIILTSLSNVIDTMPIRLNRIESFEFLILVITTLNAIVIFILLGTNGVLIWMNMHNTLRNMTVIEVLELDSLRKHVRYIKKTGDPNYILLASKCDYPFDLGIWKNLAAIFGKNPLGILFPINIIQGNGIDFETLGYKEVVEWPVQLSEGIEAKTSKVRVERDREGYVIKTNVATPR